MYSIKVEQYFDSAHFLSNYIGKCRNIHGHSWKVAIEVRSENLSHGMIVDFNDLKKEVKYLIDYFDHALIIEKNSMREETLNCIQKDGFKVVVVDFRTTAENFAYFFFENIKNKGYDVKKVEVYETSNNYASYE